MNKDNANAESHSRNMLIDFASGVFSGTSCAAIFHPWDRGVYLSVKNHRSVFSRANFHRPYHGILQTVLQRAVLGSAYYFVASQMKENLIPFMRDNLRAPEVSQYIAVGAAAGATHGIMTNTVASIKANAWSKGSHTFSSSAAEMYREGGPGIFVKGLMTSVLRDAIHGMTYEVTRNLFRDAAKKHAVDKSGDLLPGANFVSDSAAACLGTIAAAPLNHARTLKFSTPPHVTPPTIPQAMKLLWKESEPWSRRLLGRTRFLQKRLCIGVGTARASVGMALGQSLYDAARKTLDQSLKHT